MKSRNVVGGAILGAVALGIWFASFWKGPGLGGAGSGEAAVSLDSAQVNSSLASMSSTAPADKDPVADFPTDMMTVVIYGDEYRLVDGDAPQRGQVVTLNEVAERARKMTGTPEGIRVRILKGKTAQEGARADLMAALTKSGVKREEIQERAEFVD